MHDRNGSTRRDLLVFGASAFALGASGCAILRGGAVHPQWRPSEANLEHETLSLPLAEVRSVGEGRVLEARLAPAFRDLLLVPRPDGGVLVVTSHCPHNGCVVDYDQVRAEWLCPCHESRFSLDGTVKKGPAKKNLVVPPSHVDGERLVIELAAVRR